MHTCPGDDELCARLRATFAQAEVEAEAATNLRGRNTPALVFLDEIDTLCPKRSDEGTSNEERRAVALSTIMRRAELSEPEATFYLDEHDGQLEAAVAARWPTAASEEAGGERSGRCRHPVRAQLRGTATGRARAV